MVIVVSLVVFVIITINITITFLSKYILQFQSIRLWYSLIDIDMKTLLGQRTHKSKSNRFANKEKLYSDKVK